MTLKPSDYNLEHWSSSAG